MEKKEILEKVSSKKALIGEMEKTKINKANWLCVIIAGAVAVIFMVIEGLLGHYTAIYALATVCFVWASSSYFSQFFMAKRPWPVLIGAILEAIGALAMITLFILKNTGVI